MDVIAVRRLITDSMRAHTSAISLCGLPGPRAIGRERTQALHPRNSLGPRMYTSLGIPRYPSLAAPAPPVYCMSIHLLSAPPNTEKTVHSIVIMTSGPVETSSIDIGPVCGYREVEK